MKYSTYLEKITGVSIYPLISLVLFVSFFIIVSIWVLRINSNEIKHIENLPLEN